MVGWQPPEADTLASLLPQYRFSAFIGRGGMGAVYEAHHPGLDRPIAIKLLPVELAEEANFSARFEREARTLACLQHPNIVTVHDFGKTPVGHLFFVMELVDGPDLSRLMAAGPLEPGVAVELAIQICDALEYAHARQVIHRDIKPANVLRRADGQVKLADFGLARLMGEQGASGNILPESKLSEVGNPAHTGTRMGTPGYVAPEVLKTGRFDNRSDLYSVGVMLREMLLGTEPLSGEPPYAAVIRRATEENPDLRYQSAVEMKRDLAHVRNSPGTVARADGKSDSGSRIPHRGWMAAGLAAAAVMACAFVWRHADSFPDSGRPHVSSGDTMASPENTIATSSSGFPALPTAEIFPPPSALVPSGDLSLGPPSDQPLENMDDPLSSELLRGTTRILFNGKDLSGWSGRGGHWTVENGMIVGRMPAEPGLSNTCLIWQESDVSDFELVCSFGARTGYRMASNGGIEFRSTVTEDWNSVLRGCQVDLASIKEITGALWDSDGRRYLASQGQKGSLVGGPEGGPPAVRTSGFVRPDLLKNRLREDLWNHCRLVCIGGNISVFINHRLTASFRDTAEGLPRSGKLGLEVSLMGDNQGLVRGEMLYKDILLTPLKQVPGREAEAMASREAMLRPVRASLMAGKWHLRTGLAGSSSKATTLRFKNRGVLEQDGVDAGRWWAFAPNRIHMQFKGDPAVYNPDSGADFTLSPALDRMDGFSSAPGGGDMAVNLWAGRDADAPPPEFPE
ncbi:hypothetical protein GCM10023212_44530 [Luteolibacter yonseiensis]